MKFRIMNRLIGLVLFVLVSLAGFSQEIKGDSLIVRSIFKSALKSWESFDNLGVLTTRMKGRISGTPESLAAIEYTRQIMSSIGLDSVYLQEVWVKHWQRGNKEIANINSKVFGSKELSVCSLGQSDGTCEGGIYGEVVEVKDFEELKKLGEAKVKGKIVFFNNPMDPTFFYTFSAYGAVAANRVWGASEAAKYGAKAVIIRSLTMSRDDVPHTGMMRYKDGVDRIPAVAIGIASAETLSKWLNKDKELTVFLETDCKNMPEEKSYNVIGEMRGSKYPEEIVLVGGHIDAWDKGGGVHDDGIGCMQSIEVMRLFKELGIKPKRTVRAVMFMDEEIAQRGPAKYAEEAIRKKEKHIAAIESDRGGFTPTGFSIDTTEKVIDKIRKWKDFFGWYGVNDFVKGGSGVDVGPLKAQNCVVMGFVTDSQRYFDVQHSANDVMSNASQREMQLGSGTLATMVYFISEYGLK